MWANLDGSGRFGADVVYAGAVMSPWLLATFGFACVCMALYAASYRRRYLTSDPLTLWGMTFESAEAVANHLHALTGLRVVRRPAGSRWLLALVLDPILLIWGDLRSRRPERHLDGWSLEATPEIEPSVRIELSPLRASIGVRSEVALWTDGARAWTEEEGLRAWHPVGGDRWAHGTTRLEVLRARGVTRLRHADGMLWADAPLDTVDAASYPTLIANLTELARPLAASARSAN